MAFTYLILNVVMLIWAALLLTKKVQLHARLLTLGVLVGLTLVFDNLAIWTGFFTYNPAVILGIHIGLAPIEDFFYPLVAVIIVPALWKKFAPLHTKETIS